MRVMRKKVQSFPTPLKNNPISTILSIHIDQVILDIQLIQYSDGLYRRLSIHIHQVILDIQLIQYSDGLYESKFYF